MDIITQIRTITAYKGLAQKDIAEILNISPASLSRKIKNQTFTLSDINIIAEGLGFDLQLSFVDKETGQKF